MILAYALIFLIVLALILKRDLSTLARLPYKGGWMLLALVIGLFVLQATTVIYVAGQTVLQMGILVLSQVTLCFLLVLNHHIPGARLFVLGIALNLVVMIANGGWMPVTPETYHFVHPDRAVEVAARPPSSKNIILPRAETRLWLLSDIIRVTLPWRRTAVSGGDLLLIVGAAQFVFQPTSPKKKQLIDCSDSA